MLSNGEFVTSSKATKHHLALLEKIASNNLPKFIESNFVGKAKRNMLMRNSPDMVPYAICFVAIFTAMLTSIVVWSWVIERVLQ